MNSLKDKLIFCAYAEDNQMQSGANVAKLKNKSSVYWKNAVVALYSAKKQHAECEVALVTNTEVPDEYNAIFQENNIKIFRIPFDEFVFDGKSAWGLAFYKLCALKKVLQLNYAYYLMLDTDVYVQSRMDDLFTEMDYYLMLHNRHPRLENKTEMKNNAEIFEFTHDNRPLEKWGGEFVGGKKEMLLPFMEACANVYQEMINEGFLTSFGDEFILSFAADQFRTSIKNADGYMSRYWTGTFRHISTNYKYDPVSVLHVPAEKGEGMIRMYKYICVNHRLPSMQKAHRILHLSYPSGRTRCKWFIKGIRSMINGK